MRPRGRNSAPYVILIVFVMVMLGSGLWTAVWGLGRAPAPPHAIGSAQPAAPARPAAAAAPAAPAAAPAPADSAVPAIPPAPPINVIDLTGQWKFSSDRDEAGLARGWQKPGFDSTAWRGLTVPGDWESQGLTAANPNWPSTEEEDGYNGYAWYRRSVDVPADWTQGTVTLHIGTIDDSDWAFVNGVQVGTTTGQDACTQERSYVVPATALRPGKPNVIAIRVLDTGGRGGLIEGPVELLREPVATENTSPAAARSYATSSGGMVRITKDVTVPEDMKVDGDVTAVFGSVTVEGYVTGTVTAVGGSVHLGPMSRVDGTVTAVGGGVVKEGDASIGGEIVETPLPPGLGSFGHFGPWLGWTGGFDGGDILVGVFLVLLGVFLFPRRLEMMAEALPTAPGSAALHGIVGFILLPMAAVTIAIAGAFVIIVLAVTLVGIIAIPAVAIAMAAALVGIAVVAALGTVAVWLSVGRAILRGGGGLIWASLLGMILVWLVARLPGVGPLITITVTIFGFGVALMTGIGTKQDWSTGRMRRRQSQTVDHLPSAAPTGDPGQGSDRATRGDDDPPV